MWFSGSQRLEAGASTAQKLSVERLEKLRSSVKQIEIAVFEGADHNLRMMGDGKEAPFRAKLSEWLAEVAK